MEFEIEYYAQAMVAMQKFAANWEVIGASTATKFKLSKS
jgi:hypothetical protein